MGVVKKAKYGMWLTDGENFYKTVDLAEGIDENKYYDATEEEYNRRMNESAEGEATTEDCLEALAMLGVE